MKLFRKMLASALAVTMLMSNVAVNTTSVFAAPSISAGWNETLYAEWADSDPDSPNVKVGYKLSSDADYTYLAGDDLTYLVRKSSTSGYGRVDIPGLKAGRYDITITASDGTVHTRNGIQVYEYDRSGYAHFNATEGVGAYNNDGTPKDNAIIVYVTEENKNTVEIPGYEGHAPVSYTSSSTGATWTRETAGIGNILNNNHNFIYEVTGTDNHPIIFRFIGEVTAPENLTPYDNKTNELGGSKGDNGNLAITKYAKNITIEGIGDDAVINGWGFTFSQTSTCPADAGKNFEVRNLTFKNYPEDALGFQGDDPISAPIQRVWVHNNVFYPGYCANPAESDKAEGDGSCDFKRGQYYTMSYNHYIDCHKTNLLGAGDSNDQFYMTLHHNWYENVESRQPLAAGGNVHIYNTYFDNASSTTIDLRGKAAAFSEENYFENCKNAYKTRKTTSNIKTYNDILAGSSTIGDMTGKLTQATTRDQSGIPDNGLSFPNGDSMADWDTNTTHFYYDPVAKRSDVAVLNAAADVPEYVKTYSGTLKQFPITESGEITVTVKSGTSLITDAYVSSNGLTFRNNGDGTYTATSVPLGSEYIITASKEGYSNATVTTDVLQNDGDILQYTLDLPVDYDGYAVVKLTGGSDNSPVNGATVTLNNGAVLVNQGDGIYKSNEQYSVGSYTVTITNTGDYISPSSAQAINVKTTDAATEIHLDKYKGQIAVTLTKAAGETDPWDLTKATVYAGETALTNNGSGVFTGQVEVGTPYEILVNVPGWNVSSITPSYITANKDTTATATAVLTFKGQLFTWNYTEGTNTDNFFTFNDGLSDWSSASDNPQTFDGESLTKAIKVNSSLRVSFEAPMDGTLTLVMNGSGSLWVDNGDGEVSYDINTGINTIPIKAGTCTIRKNKTETRLYLLQFAGSSSGEITTDTTTETTTDTITEPTTGAVDTLNDDIEWNVLNDISGSSNGLTFGQEFRTNSEEAGPAIFTEGDKTYALSDWVQGTADPKNSEGLNPQSDLTKDRIPVSGAFIKFVPETNGIFTVAAKTNAGKITYITDGSGNIINSIGSLTSDTSYDIIRTQVQAGQTYYMYSGGSKICLYYIGFTGSGEVYSPWGDADLSGKLTSNDSALVLLHSVDAAAANLAPEAVAHADVDGDGDITANDASMILTKILTNVTFPVEG